MKQANMGQRIKNLIEETDPVRSIGLIALGIFLSLLIGTIFIAFLGANVLTAYKQLLINPLTNIHSLGEILAKSTPILIIGIGIAFSINTGLVNLGGTGQFYMGALGMILAATAVGKQAPWLVLPAGILAGCMLGGLWAAVAGWLKAYFGANEIIATLMLNYISIQIIGYLVHGPLKEPKGLMPQTAMIPKEARLSYLLTGTRVHIGIFIALACVLAYWLIMRKTSFGFNLRVIGGSIKAAAYSGINIKIYYVKVMFLSGAFAGLAGALEVCGLHYRLLEGMGGDFGFTGVVVALLGMIDPVGMIAAALFLSGLLTGAEIMQVSSGVPMTLVYILQGLIVLFMLWGRGFRKKPRLTGIMQGKPVTANDRGDFT